MDTRYRQRYLDMIVNPEVRDTFDGCVRDTLRSPIDGRVFFSRTAPLANQYSIAFKIAPQ